MSLWCRSINARNCSRRNSLHVRFLFKTSFYQAQKDSHFASTDATVESKSASSSKDPKKSDLSVAPTPVTTWNTLVIGEIVKMHQHPAADRLNVCQVNIGDPDNLLQIICGAPNAREGARVPVAKIGSKLAIKDPKNKEIKQLKIKKSKLRGELSQGMICSEAELGLTEESDGILILEEDAPIGTLLQEWSTIAQRLVALPSTVSGKKNS